MSVERPDRISGEALADILTCMEMPDTNVSERTQRTRMVGAFYMMNHLVQGEWSPSSREKMGEFLSRVIANAAQQEISIEIPQVEALPSD